MAIWPFGRKSKRHTIQVSPAEAAALHSSLEDPSVDTNPQLSRKASRRQSSRLSHRTDDARRDSVRSPSHRPISSLAAASEADHEADNQPPPRNDREPGLQRPLSRTESLLKGKVGPNKLRRRLSKRKANEIMREREIRMLSSTPIDIPRRYTAMSGDYGLEQRRRKANGRRSERYMSDISLSIRDSTGSSLSDVSDPYTFKVNAFAALTPRPAVRYVESPRAPSAARGGRDSAASHRLDKDRLQALTMSQEELYYSKRRVKDIADTLDAGALRELLDRDRRRREKKQIEDQEKLRRKLQEKADAQQAAEPQLEEQKAEEQDVEEQQVVEQHTVAATQNESAHAEDADAYPPDEATPIAAPAKAGSWLRDASKDSQATRESVDSARVIGNIDDSSVRDQKIVPSRSFAPSQDMAMSRTTLSPSHSSLRQGLSSPSGSQAFGPGSNSDLSRTIDSDRRTSDTSGRRVGTITSLFRRGSNRLKRYRERFHESSPDVSNATSHHASHNVSHESFYRVQTQSSPPPAPVVVPPLRPFIPTGNIQRSQSKFTEIFDDAPLSPPDSRLQSPGIPEERESSMEHEETSFLHDAAPSTTTGVDIDNAKASFDADPDNVPLSQSLASIDSEGSWMSGQFFRRMNKPGSPVRPMPGSFDSPSGDGASDSNALGEPELDTDTTGGVEAGKPTETLWPNEIAKRPVVVNPISRPKSTQGMLKSIPSLSPISAEDDYISDEAPGAELHRVASVKPETGYVDDSGVVVPDTTV
ncbi:hypothetical protein N7474_001035 [Penicillium riverlandense]|uniref:uncharacterized protein n=1 Tax=Penicillium riverlandense TaxID=1903569 RepID=UPI0025496037|nr:uncharacterized protein N7474_001035 [Penicillium riverlandense]KAJ5832724.1 hypothetical protein N7474_001035 [Penicillium riverlandense]